MVDECGLIRSSACNYYSTMSPVVLIVISYVLHSVGAVAVLLLSVTFSKGQRARYPLLRKLDGKQLLLAAIAIVSVTLGYAAASWKEVLVTRLSFRVARGPGTSQAVFATKTALERELLEAAAKRAVSARDAFAKGDEYFERGEFRSAAAEYQRSLEALPTLSALLNRGLSLRYVPDYAAAETELRRGLNIAAGRQEILFEAHFSLYLSSVLNSRGKFTAAEPAVRKALQTYEILDDPLGQANAHLNLGNIRYGRGEYDQAVSEWQRALDGYRTAGNRLGLGNVHSNIGGLYAERLQLDAAVRELRAAVTEYDSARSNSGLARALGGLAAVLVNQGRVSEATPLARRALQFAEREGGWDQRCFIRSLLGVMLDEEGKFDEAIVANLAALQFAIDSGEPGCEAVVRYYLACSYRQLGRLDEARINAVHATKLAGVGASPIIVSFAWTELALIYADQGDSEMARQAYTHALAVRGVDLFARAGAEAGRGIIEARLGRNAEALEHLASANVIFAKAGIKTRLARDAATVMARLTQARDDN